MSPAGGRKAKKDTSGSDRQSRGWLARTLTGPRNVTRTLIADFGISSPDIPAMTALFSPTFRSDNARREAWVTNESIPVCAKPCLKVSPDTVIGGRFRIRLSDKRASSAGANVLNARQTAASLRAGDLFHCTCHAAGVQRQRWFGKSEQGG